jgi:hypothetical protein
MIGSSWANDKAMWRLDDWWEHAELDRDKLDFLEIEFNSVVVEVKVFEVMNSLSGANLFFDILLNRGDVHEPEVIRTAE